MTSNLLRDLALSGRICQPVIFKGIHKDWEPLAWDLNEWGRIVTAASDGKIRVRSGKKHCEDIQWESGCRKLELDWDTLMHWDSVEEIKQDDLINSDSWVYHDYKHLPTFLDGLYLKKFSWNKLGFPDRDGYHSTLWIGSKGSYTPCHYDTYGCNLVCQVFGRKRWLLFPPEDTDALRPTRVPYEESSVYSQVNLLNPNQSDLQRLRQCNPVAVTMEPGDVLYVPPKWWHFVQTEDMSISVNTWIELAEDARTRLDEAVVRSVIACIVNAVSADSVAVFLNPNEPEVLDLDEDGLQRLLQTSVKEALSLEGHSDGVGGPPKKRKISDEKEFHDVLNSLKIDFPCARELQRYEFSNSNSGRSQPSCRDQKPESDGAYLKHLFNAISHPDVLKVISAQLLRNVQQDFS